MHTRLPTLILCLALPWAAGADTLETFTELDIPVGAGAHDPSVFAAPGGPLMMSWTEPDGAGDAVKVAVLDDGVWGPARTVATSESLFVNWADIPSVAMFADGTLVAHWLQSSGPSGYAYDVRLALSDDLGAHWSAPVTPHRDGTFSQHGFVTLVPDGDGMVALWLDGRAYEGQLLEEGALPGAMQLRTTRLTANGAAAPDTALDLMTCSCCQTAAAVAGGALLVAYRDRSPGEVRDIALVARRDGVWSGPVSVHDDGWEIDGCPVNGPAIAADGPRVAVAWFTGANDIPAVNVARSSDAGKTFAAPIRIDRGRPVGRVDVLMPGDGSVLVTWIEWTDAGEALYLCRLDAGACGETRLVAENTAGNSMNFPRMAATDDAVYLAWTQPLGPGTGDDTIRMIRWAR